ncbi:MAG TPA: hypothetical protein VIO64_02260 [Pseudobacteroides sp.]|uniref:Uncharacterized protein n=1 Tax=Pseudobacteroides cellulosolvens ATCC 35603 = DSM 2933 TaxID=398512 RepID=A0A0L6JTL1_9FIRM|nr:MULTISPECIES: hypothetical protein [Oscillospiraceae]KNY29059.1 hypothetical protein Bccel_4333 [Pseudobacteroides cellulosolvens ATCC 35603 = DSM 2933]
MDKKALETIVEKGCSRSFKRVLVELTSAVNKASRDYYKETESLLYKYSVLKQKVIEDERDIQEGEIRLKEKSKDIIRFSGNGGAKPPEDQVAEEYYRSRRASMERTKLRVKEIERGIDRFRSDRYFRIVELKYGIPPENFDWEGENLSQRLAEFEPLSVEEIALELGCGESTVKRNRNRLVNALKVAIFGGDAT